jgi:hypothetical protein
MTPEQKEALRPYFHGLTDDQFNGMLAEYPLNSISQAMNDYAVKLAEKAIDQLEDEHPYKKPDDLFSFSTYREGMNDGFGLVADRIKTLTKEENQ